MDNIDIELKRMSVGRRVYLADLDNVICNGLVAISPLGIEIKKMLQPDYDTHKINPLLALYYSSILMFALDNGFRFIKRNNPKTIDSDNNYPSASIDEAFLRLSSKSYYSRRKIMSILNLPGDNNTTEQAFLELNRRAFANLWESSTLDKFKSFISEEIVENKLWDNSVEIIEKSDDLINSIKVIQNNYYSIGVKPDIPSLCLVAQKKAVPHSDEDRFICDLFLNSLYEERHRLEKIKEKVSNVDPDERDILNLYVKTNLYEYLTLTFNILITYIIDGKYAVLEALLNRLQEDSLNHNKKYNLKHHTDSKIYVIKKLLAELDITKIPERGIGLYRECIVATDAEDSWLPDDFFGPNNLPDNSKPNWIRGILPIVEQGLDDKEPGNGRLKLAQMINECARIGIISEDETTKKKMAYILTGRNVGIPVDEDKPLTMSPERLPFLCYIVRHLFETGRKGYSPYRQMFEVFEGLGTYHSKVKDAVDSAHELEEQKKKGCKQVKSVNYTSLAQRAEVFVKFAPYLSKIYSWCPATPKDARTKKNIQS